eukprot:735778-Prymnesium_polylepis.1
MPWAKVRGTSMEGTAEGKEGGKAQQFGHTKKLNYLEFNLEKSNPAPKHSMYSPGTVRWPAPPGRCRQSPGNT